MRVGEFAQPLEHVAEGDCQPLTVNPTYPERSGSMVIASLKPTGDGDLRTRLAAKARLAVDGSPWNRPAEVVEILDAIRSELCK